MRILFLIPTLQNGGAERQLAYLAQELVTRNHQIHVGFFRAGPILDRLVAGGSVTHPMAALRTEVLRHRDIRNYDPTFLYRIVQLIRRLQPDIVQTCLPQMDILGGLGCALTNTCWVLREPSCADAYGNSLRAAVRRWTARSTAAVIANSEGGERYWRQANPKLLCFRVANGISLDEMDAALPACGDQFGCGPGEILVIAVGRLLAAKDHPTLIHAAARLRKSVPNIRWCICGEGPERARLQQQISQSGLEAYVRLLGVVENPWALLRRAAAFVSTSAFEGFPNAVMEAMACRCPLVVSDIPSHREFLTEETALLVPPGQPEAVARAIVSLLANHSDACARAERARALVEQFSVARMTQAYEAIYESALAIRGRHRLSARTE